MYITITCPHSDTGSLSCAAWPGMMGSGGLSMCLTGMLLGRILIGLLSVILFSSSHFLYNSSIPKVLAFTFSSFYIIYIVTLIAT